MRIALLVILYSLIILLDLFVFILQNNIAGRHITYAQIEREILDIKKKSKLLEEEILDNSSLRVIEHKAIQNGMIDAKIIYL